MDKPEITEITFTGVVKEMKGNKPVVEINLGKNIVNDLIEANKDNDPMFVTVEALNEGESKNGNYYTKELLDNIATQVNDNKLDAYRGHIEDDKRPFENPHSETIWLGAKVVRIEGKYRLFIKGYVLPYATERKSYLRTAKTIGKNVAVSIYGVSEWIKDKVSNVRKITKVTLESIDWSRSLAEGVATMGTLAITKEMKDIDSPSNNNDVILETYDNIVKQVKENTKDAQYRVISEMLDVKPDKVVSTIKEMKDELDGYRQERTSIYIDQKLKDELVNVKARGVIKEMVLADMGSDVYNINKAEQSIKNVMDLKITKDLIANFNREIIINPPDTKKSYASRKFTSV